MTLAVGRARLLPSFFGQRFLRPQAERVWPLACERQVAAGEGSAGASPSRAPVDEARVVHLNLPQVPTDWNIRAPALPSVLQNRVLVQRIEGDAECQALLNLNFNPNSNSPPKAGAEWVSGFKFKFQFEFKFAPEFQSQRNKQNLPQVPTGWNIRAPALPSVL